MKIQTHYVTFLSPGSFMSEQTTEKVDSWDVQAAVERSKEIVERYSARPYAFHFQTKEFDSDTGRHEVIANSPTYYLGGVVYSYEEVVARNDPNESILRDNMKYNHMSHIIQFANPYRITQPFREDDIRLNID